MFVFGIPLVMYVWAGLATGITGIVAFSIPKRRARHPRWGGCYLWAYTVVFLTATILSGESWQTDAYLFFMALVGYGFAFRGYAARRFRREPWMKYLTGKN